MFSASIVIVGMFFKLLYAAAKRNFENSPMHYHVVLKG